MQINDPRRLIVFTVLAAVLLAGAGLMQVAGVGSGTRERASNDRVDMPPFEMTFRDKVGESVSEFNLRWEGRDQWRETLVSSNQPVPDFAAHDPDGFKNIGSYQEVSDGKYVRFDLVRESREALQPGRRIERDLKSDATVVPGEWFADLDFLLGRWKNARVSEDDKEVTVQVTTEVDTNEWILDKETGIPVAYRVIVAGKVVREIAATAIVLLDGRVIR